MGYGCRTGLSFEYLKTALGPAIVLVLFKLMMNNTNFVSEVSTKSFAPEVQTGASL